MEYEMNHSAHILKDSYSISHQVNKDIYKLQCMNVQDDPL